MTPARLVARACAVVLCSWAWSHSVCAQSARSRVAVVRTDSSDRLMRDASTRLRAELDGAGFEVIEVDRAPGDSRAQVEAAAGSAGSFATVALNRASFGAFADVWISDHLTGKTVVRRLEVTEASNAAAVLAIRALELLRASLLEMAEPARATEPALAPPADVLHWVEPVLPKSTAWPRDFFAGPALGVSVLGLQGMQGLGLALGPSLRVSYGLGRQWFGRLSLAGPLVGPEPARAEGRASVRQEFAALDLGFATSARRFAGFGWLGAGVFHLHTAGSAASPFRATRDDVVSFLASGGLGALARLGPRTAVSAELGLLWLLPHPVVVIAGKDAGSAGVPSISFAVGVLVGL
jgi:hypothetical protein